VSASFDEPTIPPHLRRPLAAIWISLGLHAALIALIQVVPPAKIAVGEPAIEARLMTKQAAPPAEKTPALVPAATQPESIAEKVPLPTPKATTEAVPEVASVAPSPVAAKSPEAASPAARPAPAVTPGAAPSASPAAPTVVPEVAITSSVDLTYYSAREVDVHPIALNTIVPDYPADADRQRLSGKVRLQLKLEADGRVMDIEVVSALPPGVFEESAVRAFRDARFSPAQKNGRPVRARVQIEVVYDWEGHATQSEDIGRF
jgi:protein TonB